MVESVTKLIWNPKFLEKSCSLQCMCLIETCWSCHQFLCIKLWLVSSSISSRSSYFDRVIVRRVFIYSWDSDLAGLRKWVFVTLVKGSLRHTPGDSSRCETSDSVPLIAWHLIFTIHILFFVKIYGLLQQRLHVLCKYPTFHRWCKWSINNASTFFYYLVNVLSCQIILLLVFMVWCYYRRFLLLLLVIYYIFFWVFLLILKLSFFFYNFKFLSHFERSSSRLSVRFPHLSSSAKVTHLIFW